MSTIEAPTAVAGRIGSAAPVRGYYRWLALAAAAVAVVGFARSYYLKGLFGTRALPLALHVHGLIMSAWLIVFIVQTWLVAVHRVRWHRRLGVVAAVLAALIIAVGAGVTLAAVVREGRAHVVGKFHYLVGINLADLLLFAAFICAGLTLRARAEYHKRLMLLAAITLLAPAAARVALLFTHRPLAQFLAFYTCIAACVLVDTVRNRRLHPVLGWGTLTIVATFQLMSFMVQTNAWMALVNKMFG
jgi:hypothetical protein